MVMKNRVGRLLTAAVLSSAAFGSGCALFGGSYSMEIRPAASAPFQPQSLYVIVSNKADVQEPLLSSSKYGDLLDEQLMRRYTSFVQFQPTDAGSWKQVFQGNQSGFVEYEIDGETIEVTVSHELVEKSGMSEFCVVVLAFFGSGGFEQITVNHTSLDASASQVVEVGGGSLSLRDT
jgi:hypothetical protein